LACVLINAAYLSMKNPHFRTSKLVRKRLL
jgi:hypothetical protein